MKTKIILMKRTFQNKIKWKHTLLEFFVKSILET